MEKMTTHILHPTSEIMQQYRFNTRVHQPHESLATYLTQLKQLAEYCNYKESLPQMLRDHLVCGIAHKQWRKRLLSEEGVTYDRAVKLFVSLKAGEVEVGGNTKP